MPKMSYTTDEINEAAAVIPELAWYTLAMLATHPFHGHKIHTSHSKRLKLAGVISRVPSSGRPGEALKNGPWYAITRLGQLVAESAGLKLVRK